jgi:DNA-binding winged helix-turn-helix (wHTH) protein
MSNLDPSWEQPSHCQYSFADFTLDLDGGFLKRQDGQNVPLRPKPFEVLACLVKHHGRLVTKDSLIEAVWPDSAVTDNSLAQCLVEIRKVLGDESQELIRTVPRRGYTFAGKVSTAPVEFRRLTPVSDVVTSPLPLPLPTTRRRNKIGAIVFGFVAFVALAWLVASNRHPVTTDPTYTQITNLQIPPYHQRYHRMAGWLRL